MSREPKPGDVIAGKWTVVRLLARGAYGSAYEVTDKFKRRYALKLILKRADQSFREYTDHLRELQRLLSGLNSANLVLPVDAGETDAYVYQVFDLVTGCTTLDALIEENAPMHPADAMAIAAQVSSGLSELEAENLIHGDVKPSNILVTSENRTLLIDFGMLQSTEAEDGIMAVGTWRYMPPEIRRYPSDSSSSTRSVRGPLARISTATDTYALGMICVEMLTARSDIPGPLSLNTLAAFLTVHNPLLRMSPPDLLGELAGILSKILSVDPGVRSLASDCLRVFSSLSARFRDANLVPSEKRTSASPGAAAIDLTAVGAGLAATVEHLRTIADLIASATAVMLGTPTTLRAITPPEADERVLAEMNDAFSHAISRTRLSWRLGIAFSVVCFLSIVAMIVCAVTLAVTTGKLGWSLVFGATSVPVIIGTLLWRPYDRAFRATILAQQIEIIHVQTAATFRSTTDIEARLKVCREAVAGLQTLLDQEEDRTAGRRTVAREKGTSGG